MSVAIETHDGRVVLEGDRLPLSFSERRELAMLRDERDKVQGALARALADLDVERPHAEIAAGLAPFAEPF